MAPPSYKHVDPADGLWRGGPWARSRRSARKLSGEMGWLLTDCDVALGMQRTGGGRGSPVLDGLVIAEIDAPIFPARPAGFPTRKHKCSAHPNSVHGNGRYPPSPWTQSSSCTI